MNAITLPPLAREVWRLAMQPPERQLINPFFTGGELTRVSYPVDTMTHDDKLMSMRGNTPHFNFATVHHELDPGHHLQAFLSDRFNPHRAALQRTPFWREGWALYWELQLWDRELPARQPGQDWHVVLAPAPRRADRVLAQLPPRAVDAAAGRGLPGRSRRPRARQRRGRSAPRRHRRTVVSGRVHDWRLAVHGLYRELVDGGRMTATAFHDAVLPGGYMPVELVRARLLGLPITRDYRAKSAFRRQSGREITKRPREVSGRAGPARGMSRAVRRSGPRAVPPRRAWGGGRAAALPS